MFDFEQGGKQLLVKSGALPSLEFQVLIAVEFVRAL